MGRIRTYGAILVFSPLVSPVRNACHEKSGRDNYRERRYHCNGQDEQETDAQVGLSPRHLYRELANRAEQAKGNGNRNCRYVLAPAPHLPPSSLQFPSHQRRNRSLRDWGALIRCTESSSGGKCWECSWSALHPRAWICSAQAACVAGCYGSRNGAVAIESTTVQHRFRCHGSFTPR